MAESLEQMLARLGVTPFSPNAIGTSTTAGAAASTGLPPPSIGPAPGSLSGLAAANNFGGGTPAKQSIGNKLMGFINSPQGRQIALNLLAQSGPSLTPQSFGSALGKAGLASQQTLLNNRLIEAQIGRLNQPSIGSRPQRRVQSAQPLANGNIGFLDAFTGEVVDTGAKAGTKKQIVDLEGRGRFEYDPIQGTFTELTNEELIGRGLESRAEAKETGKQSAITAAVGPQAEVTAKAKAVTSLPAAIASTERFSSEGRKFIDKLKSGELETGFFRGQLPAISTDAQLFDVFSGEQILERISEATFGALSEGERAFLKETVSARTKTPEANIAIIERKIDILERAEARARERAGVDPIGSQPNVIDFNDLP